MAADGLGPVPHIMARGNGDLYARLLSPKKGGAIVALRDVDGDGRLETEERFFGEGGTGIGIWGGYLYFSTPKGIFRQRLKPDRLRPAGKVETVVSGFPPQRQHAAGAPSHACQKKD